MLPLQEFLIQGGDPSTLGINTYKHPELPLVGYKYDQVDCKHFRFDPIVINSRGIVLHKDTHQLIAKGFDRFFNLDENVKDTTKFNWNNFICQEKVDGSLILVYYYKGWRVNTSGSFGGGSVNMLDITFEELFNKYFPQELHLKMDNRFTYVFELCSPYNKVVRDYPGNIFLLSMFDDDGNEFSYEWSQDESSYLGIPTPPISHFSNIEEIKEFLKKKETEDKTFEGFVLRDNKDVRIKIKNKGYLDLHRLKNNGELNKQRVIELILNGEVSEMLIYLPELKEVFDPIETNLINYIEGCETLYSQTKDVKDQKQFALAVKDTPYSGVLFNMRKLGVNPRNFLLNHLSYAEKIIWG